MPRPRGRPPGKQVPSASSSTLQKQTLSAGKSSSTATPTRQSTRIKSSPSTTPTTTPAKNKTPQKSPFFRSAPAPAPVPAPAPAADSESGSAVSEPESVIGDEASGYEDEDESLTEDPYNEFWMDEEIEETTDSSDEEVGQKRKRKSPATTARQKKQKSDGHNDEEGGEDEDGVQKKGQELWRQGVKTGLAPGKEMWIPLPKARTAGKTPYQDHTVHPNTLAFLGDLKENNEREWLKVHDADYRQSQKDFNSFVDTLTEKVIEKDETIPELPCKDLTFRIYRDVRFSSDPTPYKTHYSGAWSRTGRKGPYAAYYLQIKPVGSFVGAGLWQPEAGPLALMRQAIDTQAHRLKTILLEGRMRKEFLGGGTKKKVEGGDEEGKVVRAFVEMNKENMLKTKPKGYEITNPNLPLLRLRSFTIGRNLTAEEVLAPDAASRIGELIGVLMPFVTYLNSVIMPDGDEEDEGDEE